MKTEIKQGASAPRKAAPNAGLAWSLSGLLLVAALYVVFFLLRGRVDLTSTWPRVAFYVVGGVACICFGMGVGHSIKALQRQRRR